MKTRHAIAILAAVGMVCGCAVMADDIRGTIKTAVSLTHISGATASTVYETISDPWTWGATSANVGTNGAANDLNMVYISNATIAGSGTNTLDLYGTLLDSFGATLNFARIKLLIVAPTNAMAGQSVTLLASAANGMTNALPATGNPVLCGGVFFLAAPTAIGYTVSNGVCDVIDIRNDSTNAAVVKVVIAGE